MKVIVTYSFDDSEQTSKKLPSEQSAQMLLSEETSWTIPRALLNSRSGYFQRLDKFKEGKEGAAKLPGFEPKVFGLFVQFLYYHNYSTVDVIESLFQTRIDTKAWVLGDYLDAPEFKDFAMHRLYFAYFPKQPSQLQACISAEVIDYDCSNSASGSSLDKLFKSIAVRYWHDQGVVEITPENNDAWNMKWDNYPDFRNYVLYLLNQTKDEREMCVDDLEDLLDTPF
jgi:hypothetical protein